MSERSLTSQFADTDMRSIFAAIASITAVGTGLGLSGPLLSLIMEQQGVSSTLIGANTSVAGIAAIVSVPFVTMISRRFGVVNTMILNIVLAASLLLAFFFFNPVPEWFLIRFLFSCNLAMIFVLSEFWINHAANEKNRGMILGIYGTVLSVGFAVGPAIVSFVGIDGIMPFIIGSALIAVAILPALYAKQGQPVMQETEKTPSIWPYIFLVPMATAAGFIFGAVEQAELSLLPVYATRFGYNEAQAALVLTVTGIGNVVFQIPLGISSDKVKDRRTILALCAGTGLLGSIALPFAVQNLYVLYFNVFLWGGVVGGMYTVGLAHLGSRLTGTDLAQANAAFVMCYAVGMTVGPQLVGLFMDIFGPNGFAIGIGLFFAIFILLYLVRRQAHA